MMYNLIIKRGTQKKERQKNVVFQRQDFRKSSSCTVSRRGKRDGGKRALSFPSLLVENNRRFSNRLFFYAIKITSVIITSVFWRRAHVSQSPKRAELRVLLYHRLFFEPNCRCYYNRRFPIRFMDHIRYFMRFHRLQVLFNVRDAVIQFIQKIYEKFVQLFLVKRLQFQWVVL